MHDRYVIGLLIAAAVIIVPAGLAQLAGAPVEILAKVAVLQLLASIAFFITSLVSLKFCVTSLVQKKWKQAGVLALAILLPIAVWHLVSLTNQPGWNAVRGI
jgi:hypothetical protein